MPPRFTSAPDARAYIRTLAPPIVVTVTRGGASDPVVCTSHHEAEEEVNDVFAGLLGGGREVEIEQQVPSYSDIISAANEIVAPHGLQARILEGVYSVGVEGDGRVYLPVLELFGEFPGWDVLAKLSTELTNKLHVSRVTFDTTSLMTR